MVYSFSRRKRRTRGGRRRRCRIRVRRRSVRGGGFLSILGGLIPLIAQGVSGLFGKKGEGRISRRRHSNVPPTFFRRMRPVQGGKFDFQELLKHRKPGMLMMSNPMTNSQGMNPMAKLARGSGIKSVLGHLLNSEKRNKVIGLAKGLQNEVFSNGRRRRRRHGRRFKGRGFGDWLSKHKVLSNGLNIIKSVMNPWGGVMGSVSSSLGNMGYGRRRRRHRRHRR